MAESSSGFVLCEECKMNEACYTISVMVNGQVTTRHLCADCMARMNMGLNAGSIRHMLGALLTAFTGVAAPDMNGAEDISCPRCHMALSAFTKSGRLGCPGCYEAFRDHLTPMLQQLHGRVEHAGRKPLVSESDQKKRARHQELVRLMEQAVALEDFETAAQLRDRINALAQEEDA